MADQHRSSSIPVGEVYTHRANPAFDAAMARRTATGEAAFFLPHLRPGMRLLDVGCGPGSVTLGLAEIVAPGEVVGLDLRPAPIAQARVAASERGIVNARFEVGSAYALPFPDGSFDAAFALAVLMHLRAPARALAEMRRVLRPGGVVGVRDVDFGGRLIAPLTPLRERFTLLRDRVHEHNGGQLSLGRAQRRLLLDAGFARAEAGASAHSAGTVAETRGNAAFHKAELQGVAQTALAEGWADQATLDAMQVEFDAWAERPDAFFLTVYCHAVGWVDG